MSTSFPDPRRGQWTSQVAQDELRELVQEVKSRKIESLRLYEPLSYQDAYHRCRAKEAILVKPNQVGGPQKKDTPVLTPTGWRRLGDLQVGDEVFGGDGKVARVLSVTQQGWLPIFNLAFDDETLTNCAENHFWKCQLKAAERFHSNRCFKKDKWSVYSLREIREHGGDDPIPRDRAVIPVASVEFPEQPVPVAPYTLGVLLGDGCICHDTASFTSEDAAICDEILGELPAGMAVRVQKSTDNGKASCYHLTKGENLLNPVIQGLRVLGLMGLKSVQKFIPACYLLNSRSVRLAVLQGLMDTDGYCTENGVPFYYSCSPRLAQDVMFLVRSLGGKAKLRWKEAFITKKHKPRGRPPVTLNDYGKSQQRLFEEPRRCLHMAEVQFSLPRDVRIFRLERKQSRREAFQGELTTGRVLQTIRPAGNAECVCIGVDSPDHTYVTEDFIVTHNSLAHFVEIARALTGQDPYGKYPKRDGLAVCVAYGERHIGTVIHRYLFRWGAFKMIRDLGSGDWRTYRPWPAERLVDGKPGDLERATEAQPAPPLIPKRFIQGKLAWQKRALNIFLRASFTTGWELYTGNSEGDPSHLQGLTNVYLYAFDEDVAQGGWYEEAVQRTTSVNGLLRWNAMPHARTDDILNLIRRAEEEEEKDDPQTVAIRVHHQDENPYIPEAAKAQNVRIAMSMGEDVYRKRILGELTNDSVLMYPGFNKQVHGAERRLTEKDLAEEQTGRRFRSALQRAYTDNGGRPPDDWTRYVIVDPGFNVCAATFIATPPESLGDWRVQYGELYLRNATARLFASELKQKVGEQPIRDFLIDMHGGRLRGAQGIQWVQEYQEEIEKLRVECEIRGSRFGAGCDNIKLREERLRKWLEIRGGCEAWAQSPTLYIDLNRCPNTVREMLTFRKKTIRQGGMSVTIDEANRRQPCHALECLEMAAAHGCPYVKPKPRVVADEPIDRWMAERKHRERKRRYKHWGLAGQPTITLGPQGAFG